MKKTFQILTLISLIALSFVSYAKSQNGVYMTADDFVNKKLSYDKDNKIHLNNSVWEMPYITVTDHSEKLKLNKNKIFGYADGDKKVYRFYKNAEYEIAEAGSMMIYMQVERIAQSKGFMVKKNFYFSTSAGSKIVPLTLDNLKSAYRTNERFIDLLDQFFSNSDVTTFDRIHNMYKVNYVFAKTLK